MIILIILASLIFFIFLIIVISMYNGLVRSRNNVRSSFSTIDVMLKKRHDLIPNLVSSVKALMEHEKGLLENITKLRTKASSLSGNGEERSGIENELSTSLGQLQLSIENYPIIKSDRNVLQLQASLNDVEEQISASRRSYNGYVTTYSNKLESFPSNLVAGVFSFEPESLFEISEIERKNVNVDQLFQ